jgi:hypothetical protein
MHKTVNATTQIGKGASPEFKSDYVATVEVRMVKRWIVRVVINPSAVKRIAHDGQTRGSSSVSILGAISNLSFPAQSLVTS